MDSSLTLRGIGVGMLLGVLLLAGFTRAADGAGLDAAMRPHVGKRATVVVFLGAGCPVSNSYLPHLNELAGRFGPQGVRFVGVNANDQDSAADVARHAKEFAVAFPV